MSDARRDDVPFLDLGVMHAEMAPELDEAWRGVVDGGAFVGGPAVDGFERAWASYCGRRHALGVASGTDALELVLRGLGVGPGDEVVVPANTFVATVEAVVHAGATPRFADVDPGTLLLTPATAGPALRPQTAAVVAVDLYGAMPDLDGLAALARDAGAVLVEDAAQAHGATLGGRRAGSFGVAGCFSFYPGKNLGALGDAGAVVTDDAALAGRVASLRDHGRDARDRWRHPRLGRNSRLDAVQAAVLACKLPRLDRWNAMRRALVGRYRERLAGAAVSLVGDGGGGACHLAVARVRRRDEVRAALATGGVETGVHYPVPCHRQPPYRRFPAGPLPESERAAGEVLSLPLYPHLRPEQVDRVCEVLVGAVDGSR